MRNFITVFLVLLQVVAFAQPNLSITRTSRFSIPPAPRPARLVNDLGALLHVSEANRLEQKLLAFNRATSAQLVVVTVPTLEGNDIALFALDLFNQWGIGRKGVNDGVLVLVAMQERQARITVGYGFESVLADSLCARIIKEAIAPGFKEGNYYLGLDQGTDSIIKVITKEALLSPRK